MKDIRYPKQILDSTCRKKKKKTWTTF